MFIPGPASTAIAQSGLALFDAKGGTETLKLPPGSYTPLEFPPPADMSHLETTMAKKPASGFTSCLAPARCGA